VLRRGARWAIKTRWLPFELRSRLRWRRTQGTWLARRPTTFTDKVQWKMLKDRRPLLTTFADKVAAREFVAKVVGTRYLTECYAVASDPAELDRSALPREFVAKVSHGCGGLWIVTDDAAVDGGFARGERHVPGPLSPLSGWHRILRRPGSLDWDALVETFRAWLGWNYADVSLEWAYLNIRPRMMVEELLREPGRVDLPDYKLFVFDGRARLIQVDAGRHTDHRRNMYLPDWTSLEVEYTYPRLNGEIERPASLGEMVEVAEALGSSVDFVRVDLYDVDGRVVFGELTNYPEAGARSFVPPSFNDELGAWWVLPRKYRS